MYSDILRVHWTKEDLILQAGVFIGTFGHTERDLKRR